MMDEHRAIIAQSSVKIAECKAKVQAIEAKLHQSKIKGMQQILKASHAARRDVVFDYLLIGNIFILSLLQYSNDSTKVEATSESS